MAGHRAETSTGVVPSHDIGILLLPSTIDTKSVLHLACLTCLNHFTYVCFRVHPSSKHLSHNLSGSVRNTALQIGTQLVVKVNGSDLRNRDLQLPHLLWQPWHRNILCTKKQLFFKREWGRKKKKSKVEQENVFSFFLCGVVLAV